MDAPNPFLIIPRAKKLLRYLGKVDFMFCLNGHGINEIPIRHHTRFFWNPTNPNHFKVLAYDDNQFTGEMVDQVTMDVPIKGRPLEEFFKQINEAAYEKAKQEYLHQSIVNYLNEKIEQYEH